MQKVEKSRSNLEIVWAYYEDDDKDLENEVDTEIWYLKTPPLDAEPRIFTLEEAMFFNGLQDRPIDEATVTNESFRKMKVLPIFGLGVFVLSVAGLATIVGARF